MNQEFIVWVKTQVENDTLLRVAFRVTDEKFKLVGALEQSFYNPLIPELTNPEYPTPAGDDRALLTWLRTFENKSGQLILGAQDTFQERTALSRFLPKTYRHLSSRSLDVASLELFYSLTEGTTPLGSPTATTPMAQLEVTVARVLSQAEANAPF